jgi:serine phosphatase RsbU (regulator of sigma subunit)
MIGYDVVLDAPTTARYHREAVEQIIQCVEERVYCALLGPHLCGKTLLLRFIEHNLANLLDWTCAFIDLSEIRTTTRQAFFADLIRQTASRFKESSGHDLPVPDEKFASSAVFRAFLSDSLETIGRDLVLLMDPLEALPTDLVQALLTSLRAAYMDQQMMAHQVTVVVSGALSLATLTVGESSPFRGIARTVFIGDLQEVESQALILEFLVEEGISATTPAMQRLLQSTSGDIFLMRKISHLCAEYIQSRVRGRLRSRDVTNITNRFLRDEVFQYTPLIEAVRLIEEDPDLMQCILQLLEHDSVPRTSLPLPLSPDLDPLYLTGVVVRVDGDAYRLQNLIYHQFLTEHFTPGRVGHILAMTGRWDSAIDYLEASIRQGMSQSRSDLLSATINSMYASQDMAQAVHFLRRGLSAAFGINESQLWFRPTQERYLQLIGPAEVPPGSESMNDFQIELSADRLETRAYRSQVPLRGQEEEQQIVRAIPLVIPGIQPVGVVTIFDDLVTSLYSGQRDRDLQMVGFLNQAARALQRVSLRRKELAFAGRVQASLLPDVAAEVPGWQIAAAWRPARETSGDFYDIITMEDGRIGIVIADVVDKGMGAALLMALSRTLIRSYASDYTDRPEDLLGVTNQRILADIDTGMFVTLFYGILNPETGTLTYSNAGHPPPFIFTGGESNTIEALPRTGIPLGISDDEAWDSVRVQIPPGGLLLLYTDGVLDIQDPTGAFYDEEQIQKTVLAQMGQSAREVQEALVSSVYAFAGTEPQVDDITMMLLVRDGDS